MTIMVVLSLFWNTVSSNQPQQISTGHLNINPIRSKFNIMKPILTHDIDIFMVTETKLDDPFPVSILLKVLLPFKLDRKKNGRQIILYVHS